MPKNNSISDIPVTMSALSIGMFVMLMKVARHLRESSFIATHVISPSNVAMPAESNPIDSVFDRASAIRSSLKSFVYQSSVKPVQCPR